jgi:hypothetical protein
MIENNELLGQESTSILSLCGAAGTQPDPDGAQEIMMTTARYVFPLGSPLKLAIDLAQATFVASTPSAHGRQTATAGTPAALPRRGWLDRLDAWCVRQEQRARDRYLAQSVDLVDLEYRIRDLERRGYR